MSTRTRHAPGRRLIVMTRFPAPGKVKTRLIPALGPEGAALLHRRMTERTLEVVRRVDIGEPIQIEVCYADAGESEMREWLGPGVGLREQLPGDLGQRMWRAFEAAFDEGMGTAVIIGADHPDLAPDHLLRALGLLRDHDLVLGPAEDGGYYLIGMHRPIPELFTDIPWSTARVHGATLAAAERLGLAVAETALVFDVDLPEDLERVPANLLEGIPWRRP